MKLLKQMLLHFNEGRSKSYYCIAATVLEPTELAEALNAAKEDSVGLDIKDRSKILHSKLDRIAEKTNLCLKLRR